MNKIRDGAKKTNEKVNQQAKNGFLEFIDAILTLEGWHNIGSVLLFPKGVSNKGMGIDGYIQDMSIIRDMRSRR